MSGSGISWAICKSASHSSQKTMPVPHHSVFLQAGCPTCRPTNSVKALKALVTISFYLLKIIWHHSQNSVGKSTQINWATLVMIPVITTGSILLVIRGRQIFVCIGRQNAKAGPAARPAVSPATLKRAATNFAAWWTEARWVWTVYHLRLLPDSVVAAIWTRALLRLSPAR